jgi:hypothetical protein
MKSFAPLVAPAILLVLLVGPLGCNRYEKPRSREDIFNDRNSVDTLYLTDDGRKIIAPGTVRGMIVDPASGKLAWEAWQCDNPQCPGRKPDGSPLLFPWPDPFAYVTDDGKPGIHQPQTEEDFKRMEAFANKQCPACLKERNLASETREEREQYRNWLKVHVLPQAAARLKELDAEYQAYLKRQNESKKQPAP